MNYKKRALVPLALVLISCQQQAETSDTQFFGPWFVTTSAFQRSIDSFLKKDKNIFQKLSKQFPEVKNQINKLHTATVKQIKATECSFIAKAYRAAKSGNDRFLNPYFVMGLQGQGGAVGGSYSVGKELVFALNNFQIASYDVTGKIYGGGHYFNAGVGAYIGLGFAISDIAQGGVHNAWKGYFKGFSAAFDLFPAKQPFESLTGFSVGASANVQAFFGGYEKEKKFNEDLNLYLDSFQSDSTFSRFWDSMFRTENYVDTVLPINNKESAVGFTMGIGASVSVKPPSWYPITQLSTGLVKHEDTADFFKRSVFPTLVSAALQSTPLELTAATTYYVPEKSVLVSVIKSFNKSSFLRRFFPVKYKQIDFNGNDPYIRIDSGKRPATFADRAINMSNAIMSFYLSKAGINNTTAGQLLTVVENPAVFASLVSVRGLLALVGAYKDLENSISGANNYMTKKLQKCNLWDDIYEGPVDVIDSPYVTG